METVAFNCSHCGKRMGVSKAHLGTKVHCPHCRGVVQSPAPEPPAPPVPPPAPEVQAPAPPVPPVQAVMEAPPVEPAAAESQPSKAAAVSDDIFAPQEGSDIFGQSRPSGLEMPSPPPIEPEPLPEAAVVEDEAIQEPHAPWYDAPKSESGKSRLSEDIAPPRYRQKSSILGPMLLMFLIPYSLVTTGYIAWMLMNRPRVPEGLELLPDPPDPKKQDRGVERVKHDGKLPDHLKVAMNEPLQVGDIEVTPVQVRYENSDLILKLKLRNKSSQYAFNPLPDHFVNMLYYQTNKPYTFLDPGAKELRCYGGFVMPSKEGGRLKPGEEMFVELITADRDKAPDVMKLSNALVWRVQLRRGMVETRKGNQSATAVVGVEFTSSVISKVAS